MLILEINPRCSVPIYEQIADGVLRLIRSGDLSSGAVLPSVRQLAGDLEINPNTVARAYRALERNRLLETAGRRGTRVAPDALEFARSAVIGRLDEIVDRALRESAQLGVDAGDLIDILVKRSEPASDNA